MKLLLQQDLLVLLRSGCTRGGSCVAAAVQELPTDLSSGGLHPQEFAVIQMFSMTYDAL